MSLPQGAYKLGIDTKENCKEGKEGNNMQLFQLHHHAASDC